MAKRASNPLLSLFGTLTGCRISLATEAGLDWCAPFLDVEESDSDERVGIRTTSSTASDGAVAATAAISFPGAKEDDEV